VREHRPRRRGPRRHIARRDVSPSLRRRRCCVPIQLAAR
jgi:hypothetical protein